MKRLSRSDYKVEFLEWKRAFVLVGFNHQMSTLALDRADGTSFPRVQSTISYLEFPMIKHKLIPT